MEDVVVVENIAGIPVVACTVGYLHCRMNFAKMCSMAAAPFGTVGSF